MDRGCGELGAAIVRDVRARASHCCRASVVVEDVARLLREDRHAIADAATIVIGGRTADGRPSEEMVAVLRESFPHVGVYVCARPSDVLFGRLRVFAWAGADDAFVLATDADVRILVRAIEMRILAPAAERALRSFVTHYEASPGQQSDFGASEMAT